MTTQPYHHDYPYRLKIQHFDLADLRLERKGRWLRVDPSTPPDEGEVVVLTSASPGRVRATAEALRAGRSLTIVATAEVLAWARGLATGSIDGHVDSAEIDGVRVELVPYAPPAPGGRSATGLLRAAAGAARGVLSRGPSEAGIPAMAPSIVAFTFPDGSRLLHLDLALHAATDARWLEGVVTRFGAPEWLLVGQPYGEVDAVARLAPRFSAKRVLVTELSNGERRERGLPTELVTPLRDRLVAAGVEAHVFATQTSYRFE